MGLLTLVAVCYCGPIFWGLISKGKQTPKSAFVEDNGPAPDFGQVPEIDLAVAPASEPVITKTVTVPGKTNWTEVAKWIEDDPLMRPVRRALDSRDPFAEVVKQKVVANEEPTEAPEEVAEYFQLERLPIALRGVFIGPARLASINDQVVREKDKFDVPHPLEPGRKKLALELRQVDVDFVVIAFKDQTLKIELNQDVQGR